MRSDYSYFAQQPRRRLRPKRRASQEQVARYYRHLGDYPCEIVRDAWCEVRASDLRQLELGQVDYWDSKDYVQREYHGNAYPDAVLSAKGKMAVLIAEDKLNYYLRLIHASGTHRLSQSEVDWLCRYKRELREKKGQRK